MTSALQTSEVFLAEAGCAAMEPKKQPRVLIGGLGLGFTLQAALAALPPKAEVVVCELNEAVVEWCRGPVAVANNGAALDPRVRFVLGDVTQEVERATKKDAARYDAILWDLYVGPTRRGQEQHPLYGARSVRANFLALSPSGVFGVWCETPSEDFEKRLERHGFSVSLCRTRGRGLRHAVYLAQKPIQSGRKPTNRASPQSK